MKEYVFSFIRQNTVQCFAVYFSMYQCFIPTGPLKWEWVEIAAMGWGIKIVCECSVGKE